jgi:signal peptidase I
MLLKRVVALPGEPVEFREGDPYVDGNLIEEAYVHYRSNWEFPKCYANIQFIIQKLSR